MQFCATRKSAMQGAEILAKDVKSSYVRSAQHRITLQNHSFHIKDAKLRGRHDLKMLYPLKR